MAETKAYYDPRSLTEVSVMARPEIGSLQQAFLQIESALDQAHAFADQMEGVPTADTNKGPPHSDGAVATAERCLNRLSQLNERLHRLSEKVGHL